MHRLSHFFPFPRAARAVCIAGALAASAAHAQSIERVKLTDGELACAAIYAEINTLTALAGNPQATARKDFLTGLFVAKGCKTSDLAFAGNPVAPDVFRRLVAGGASAAPSPATAAAAPAATAPAGPPARSPADIQAALQAPVAPLDGLAMRGEATLKGRRFYISEYRVLFETGGSVTASSRAAYLGGTNYGATRMTIEYQVPQLDLAVLQAITDKAYADFLARLEAAGARPEPPEAIQKEFGVVYEANIEPSKPAAPVSDEFDLGYGKRRYVVMAPTGLKLNSRGFAGLGAGNMSGRMGYIKGNVEAISVSVAVNLAAQESSGSGSSLFRSGSSANASAAMEVAGTRHLLLQSHAHTQSMALTKPLPVPGQFATLRETGGYDTRQDAAVRGLQILGALGGVAANQSKKVEMAVDVDHAAMARLALQGLATVNQGIAAGLK